MLGLKKKKTSLPPPPFVFTKFFERNNHPYINPSNYRTTGWRVIQYILAISITSAALYCEFLFQESIGTDTQSIILISAILLSGWIGGFGPAITATCVAAVGTSYFFLPHTAQGNWDYSRLIQIAILITEGFFIGVLLQTRLRSNQFLKERVKQQAIIAQLGHYALATANMHALFSKAAELLTQTLDVTYCQILELLPGRKTFLLKAGVGWEPGLVGHAIITGGTNSQGGYTLIAQKPVIVKDLKKEKRFYAPELLLRHHIVSGMSVIIPGKKNPYGILGVHSDRKKIFTSDDIYFIEAIANILATALEKKTADQQHRESEIRFQTLFDSNIIGAFIAHLDGSFIQLNDAFLKLIGYTAQEIKEQHITIDSLTLPHYLPVTHKAFAHMRQEGVSHMYEKIYVNKQGGHVPVLVALSKLPHDQTCIGFVLDMSKQKELERRKDEFITMASHELKTPITSLKILTQFLKQRFAAKDFTDSVKYLNKMDKQADKLTSLITMLLDITKLQTGSMELHKELFNLNDFAREIVSDMQDVTPTHTLLFEGNIRDAVVGDKERLGQVLTNLLTNAIKYSPKNSRIRITTSATETDALVQVKDMGLGIERKHQGVIFDRFFRVNQNNDETYPGLGMGLFISSEIIKKHNGKIWVESEKGKGSTFSFSFPLPNKTYETS